MAARPGSKSSLARFWSTRPTSTIPTLVDVTLVDSVPDVIDLVPAGVEKFSGGRAIFQKPTDHVNHLKPLHVNGYINGKLINNMLVDNGAMVNLMPYSLYKKLGGYDEELIKTRRTV